MPVDFVILVSVGLREFDAFNCGDEHFRRSFFKIATGFVFEIFDQAVERYGALEDFVEEVGDDGFEGVHDGLF